MAHKTKINGTAYEVTGGTTQINGTKYQIGGGRTVVKGTGYDVPFGVEVTLIGAYTDPSIASKCRVTISDKCYIMLSKEWDSGEICVSAKTGQTIEIEFSALGSEITTVYLNDRIYSSGYGGIVYYDIPNGVRKL